MGLEFLSSRELITVKIGLRYYILASATYYRGGFTCSSYIKLTYCYSAQGFQ